MPNNKIREHQTAATLGPFQLTMAGVPCCPSRTARGASSGSSGAKEHNIICKHRCHPNVINLDEGQAFSGAKNPNTSQTKCFAPSPNPLLYEYLGKGGVWVGSS